VALRLASGALSKCAHRRAPGSLVRSNTLKPAGEHAGAASEVQHAARSELFDEGLEMVQVITVPSMSSWIAASRESAMIRSGRKG